MNASRTSRNEPDIFPMKLHALSRLLHRGGLLHQAFRCGFTLVELLVVVAIIGILAALLTPVVNSVKQKGNQARCVGNLRSIGAAAGAWSAANNNQVLFQQEGNSDTNKYPDYLGDWTKRIVDTPNASSSSLFRCPSDKSYGGIGGNRSYACSLSTYNTSTKQGFVYPAVLEASKKIIVIDAVVGGGCIIKETEFYNKDFGGKISFRHFGRANALFADGHVETLPSRKEAPAPAVALPWTRDDALAKKWMDPSIPGN